LSNKQATPRNGERPILMRGFCQSNNCFSAATSCLRAFSSLAPFCRSERYASYFARSCRCSFAVVGMPASSAEAKASSPTGVEYAAISEEKQASIFSDSNRADLGRKKGLDNRRDSCVHIEGGRHDLVPLL